MNKRDHAIGGIISATTAAYWDEVQRADGSMLTDAARLRILTAGGLGGLCGSLPDLLEPAMHPNHRQFFHSIAFALALVFGIRKVYGWEPTKPLQHLVKIVMLAAGSAYLMHLVMDATTPKSLPLIGN